MHRYAAVSLLCALLAVVGGLTAAPAPLTRTTGPWFTGWDRPVDPTGNCNFDRKGAKLTINGPGEGHDLDVFGGGPDGPRLQRDMMGDFVVQVQVRVSGGFCRAGGAGILLTDGKTIVRMMKTGESFSRGEIETIGKEKPIGPWRISEGQTWVKAEVLRIVRRGNKITTWFSEDSKVWWQGINEQIDMRNKIKLGVFVKATGSGAFKAEFDQFKLTR